MRQSLSDIIEISSDTVDDSAKTYDSQETISKEKMESDFFKNKGIQTQYSYFIITSKRKICEVSVSKRKRKMEANRSLV